MYEYKLIRAHSIEELETKVKEALSEGYELIPTPIVPVTQTSVVWYLREMYRVSTSAYQLHEEKSLTFADYQAVVDSLLR